MRPDVRVTPESVAAAADRAIQAASLPSSLPELVAPIVEENFAVHRTHIPGFSILTDKGGSIAHLTQGQIERFYELGGPYVLRAEVIDKLDEAQKKPKDGEPKSPHDELEDFATLLGIRGGRDEGNGWEVQLNRQTTHDFDPDLIKQSGPKAASFVTERVAMTVLLDPKTQDVPGFVASTKRRMNRQGIPVTALTQESQVIVNEKGLIKAQTKGEVVLLPGAHEVRVTRHNVVPRMITTEGEREVIDDAVQGDLQVDTPIELS